MSYFYPIVYSSGKTMIGRLNKLRAGGGVGGGVVTSGRGRPSRGVGRVGPKERSAVDIVQDYIKKESNQVAQEKGMDGMEEMYGRNVSDNSHGTVMCPCSGSRQTPKWNRGRPILRGSSQSHLYNERPVSPK
jgi:hypothetical protein